ncbi:hypothetical protein GPECTOR_9g743 [Gonium pectorale]|uniref:Prolyl 4-hydroxylase alpha subunit Fe(2+) 2OG dioxygenase domain-containing protein n=1 Tax=Gonium pectorale TaxID=33097 RepID=A0A150GS70_GONPE|nr:hypothetical protein GPECTOR_9g743 [Gonium pectorale]|eukprot:KXZ52697.1 hypothetical protein GPECTOR_9g743 [Gonium pectorale]
MATGEGDFDWERQLQVAVASMDARGTFAWVGASSRPLPSSLTVLGLGEVTLPISSDSAAALLRTGEPATFGGDGGSPCIVDTELLRATQLDASRITFPGAWRRTLEMIEIDAQHALGAAAAFGSLRLRRLLLYEPGGNFRAHRDTELEPGVYGTLAVQLPVAGGHTGGELLIGHGHAMRRWRTEAGGHTPYVPFAAYFSACERQLSPITSGLRAVLVFSMVCGLTSPLPRPPPSAAAARCALAGAVLAWEATEAAAAAAAESSLMHRPLCAIPLQYKYGTSGLSFGALQGRDAHVVALLCGCPGLDVHLAMVTKKEIIRPGRIRSSARATGGDDPQSWQHRRRDPPEPAAMEDEYYHDNSSYTAVRGGGGYDRDDDMGGGYDPHGRSHPDGPEAVVEGAAANAAGEDDDGYAEEYSYETAHWTSRFGPAPDFAGCQLALHNATLGSSHLFGRSEAPDECRTEQPEGESGPLLIEHTYYRSVAVLWPRSHRATVAEAAGFRATLHLLEKRLVERAAELAAAAALAAAATAQQPPAAQPQQGGPSQQRPQTQTPSRDAATEALAEALIRAAITPHGPGDGHGYSPQAPDAGGVVRALQLLTALPQIAAPATPGARSAAARLVAVLPAPLVFGTDETKDAAVRASGLLCEAAFDASVAAAASDCLASGRIPEFDRCLALAFAATTPPGLRHRVAERLLERLTEAGVLCGLPAPYVPLAARLACDGPPELLRHLSGLAEAALRRSDSGELVWAVLREEAVERAVSRDDPNAEALVSALMARMLSSRPGGGSDGGGGIATLDAGGVKAAAQLVCSGPPCVRQHQAAFASGVLARPDAQALLPELLALPEMRAAAALREPGALALAANRARALKRAMAGGPPALSWEQPEAQMPCCPWIEAFLRGPNRELTFSMGQGAGMREADRWAKLFNAGGMGQRNCDAVAAPAIRNKTTCCRIVKGQRFHDRRVREYRAAAAELGALRALVPPPVGTTGGSARSAPAAPAAAGGRRRANGRRRRKASLGWKTLAAVVAPLTLALAALVLAANRQQARLAQAITVDRYEADRAADQEQHKAVMRELARISQRLGVPPEPSAKHGPM